jgi:hypothetical protein
MPHLSHYARNHTKAEPTSKSSSPLWSASAPANICACPVNFLRSTLSLCNSHRLETGSFPACCATRSVTSSMPVAPFSLAFAACAEDLAPSRSTSIPSCGAPRSCPLTRTVSRWPSTASRTFLDSVRCEEHFGSDRVHLSRSQLHLAFNSQTSPACFDRPAPKKRLSFFIVGFPPSLSSSCATRQEPVPLSKVHV